MTIDQHFRRVAEDRRGAPGRHCGRRRLLLARGRERAPPPRRTSAQQFPVREPGGNGGHGQPGGIGGSHQRLPHAAGHQRPLVRNLPPRARRLEHPAAGRRADVLDHAGAASDLQQARREQPERGRLHGAGALRVYGMLRKGLFRRGGNLPTNAEFEIAAVDDPLGAGRQPRRGSRPSGGRWPPRTSTSRRTSAGTTRTRTAAATCTPAWSARRSATSRARSRGLLRRRRPWRRSSSTRRASRSPSSRSGRRAARRLRRAVAVP